MPGRFPIFKLLIYFLLHIDVFLTVLRFLAGITLKICEFQVRFSSKNYTYSIFNTLKNYTYSIFPGTKTQRADTSQEVSALWCSL